MLFIWLALMKCCAYKSQFVCTCVFHPKKKKQEIEDERRKEKTFLLQFCLWFVKFLVFFFCSETIDDRKWMTQHELLWIEVSTKTNEQTEEMYTQTKTKNCLTIFPLCVYYFFFIFLFISVLLLAFAKCCLIYLCRLFVRKGNLYST